MQLALDEAIKGRYQTYKNPLIGVVIVKDDQVIAQGHQDNFEQDHIIKKLLASLDATSLQGATLYTNFEPCTSFSEGGSCTDLIIKSGITQVVIGQTDPRGSEAVERLLDKKLSVNVGILETEAKELNKHFNYFYENGRPFITVKQTNSLDHMVSAANSPRVVLNNPAVINRIHLERADYQAIVIGSNTAMIDNPSLHSSQASDYPPIRVVLDRRGRLFKRPDLKLFTDQSQATWIFTQHPELFSSLHNSWVKIFQTDGTIEDVVNQLTKAGIQSLYVEGGRKIHQAFWQAGLVDELISYQAPFFLGKNGYDAFTPDNTVRFTDLKLKQLADNFRIEGKISHV